jgi:hypothetical protein
MLLPHATVVYSHGAFIGRDRVCLMKSHLCDVAQHEIKKKTVTESVLLIMAPANDATKFEAYRYPSLPTSNLNQANMRLYCRKCMM